MKKSLFFVALGALALTSCSQDEVKQVNQDAVTFSVVADNASRGAVIYNDKIKEFNVTAFLQEEYTGTGGTYMDNGKTFMEGVDVKKDDSGNWGYDILKYWPTSGAINFYSYAPLSLTGASFTKDEQTITYSVPTKCSEQLDVLYAFNKGLTKADKNVAVNFRHALSQVIFKAKCTKGDLKVFIDGVRVVNVKSNGVLAMPTISTTVQAADGKTETDASWGTWTVLDGLKSYPATMDSDTEIELATLDTKYDLSKATDPLLLMPQELKPATITDNYMKFDGAFFAINCRIMSVEDGNEIQLWPAEAGKTAEVAIPVTSPDKVTNADGTVSYFWKQGRRYVYTFEFGKGAGYIGPDETDKDGETEVPENGDNTADPNEPGDPVLVPVTFTVTVDQFQNAASAVDLNTGN